MVAMVVEAEWKAQVAVVVVVLVVVAVLAAVAAAVLVVVAEQMRHSRVEYSRRPVLAVSRRRTLECLVSSH